MTLDQRVRELVLRYAKNQKAKLTEDGDFQDMIEEVVDIIGDYVEDYGQSVESEMDDNSGDEEDENDN